MVDDKKEWTFIDETTPSGPISGNVINDYLEELVLGSDDDDITVSGVDEETDFFDEGIIPQSWYDFFEDPEVETPIEGLPNDVTISDLNENQPLIDEDHWINNLIPFQEGDPSNTLMTDYIFPGIDKGYDAISNIGTEDLKDAGMDLLKMVPNTVINVPETYSDILTLPFQGAMDLAGGNYSKEAMLKAANRPLLAPNPTHSLFEYSDNPVSSNLAKYGGEWFGGLWGAKKIQDALMQAKKTPNWLKSFMLQAYPYFTRSSAGKANIPSALKSAFDRGVDYIPNKRSLFRNALNITRGAGQYGALSGIFSLPLAATAFAASPSAGAGQSELDWERENMNKINRMTSRDNMMRNFEAANTRTVDQGPGPRDNYRGL